MCQRHWPQSSPTVSDPLGHGLGRWFDVVIAAAVLILGAPVWSAVALAVKLSSKGPALYRSIRCGQHGETFEVMKFRSMRVAEGPQITSHGDSRITRVGSLLRASKLDEIPQLINVLRGDMAIVGPRPEDPAYVNFDDPLHQLVLEARPGLTSRASVEYRHEEQILAATEDPEETYRTEVLPMKLRLDAAWLAERSIGSDIRIVVDTAMAILRPHRA